MGLTTLLGMTGYGIHDIGNYIDYQSKFTYFVLVKTDIGGDKIAQTFIDTVVILYSILEKLISDHDLHFASSFQKLFLAVLGAKVTLLTAYHP